MRWLNSIHQTLAFFLSRVLGSIGRWLVCSPQTNCPSGQPDRTSYPSIVTAMAPHCNYCRSPVCCVPFLWHRRLEAFVDEATLLPGHSTKYPNYGPSDYKRRRRRRVGSWLGMFFQQAHQTSSECRPLVMQRSGPRELTKLYIHAHVAPTRSCSLYISTLQWRGKKTPTTLQFPLKDSCHSNITSKILHTHSSSARKGEEVLEDSCRTRANVNNQRRNKAVFVLFKTTIVSFCVDFN